MTVNPETVLLLIKEIKRPKSGDTITINGIKFPMKPLKQFLNTLKNHSYSLELHENNLHCHYQNKQSVGIFKFKGSSITMNKGN